ncbi:MAG: Clp protease/crotonase-like domain-containing protein [Planctomycetota bacterium]|jgi:ClpP class serine protease
MKSQTKLTIAAMLLVHVSFSVADTFKHNESGEVFTGFATQKITADRTLVYNSDEGKMLPVVLSDYEVTSDRKGRRNTISLLLLDKPEIFLSDAVSKKAAAIIIDASNKGPQAIILQIDGPGGGGDYMKMIADAVSQTKNCPIIAYINEGAYSAAAVVALACDKIYIKSTAGIGAVGPVAGASVDKQSYAEHLSVYNSDSLLTHSVYVTSLAQQYNRPEMLAKALIDKRISIIEVANIDGSRAFVAKQDRQATQTLIRTLCEGMSATESENISPADVVGKVLNLTGKDAVELGLADGTAESVAEILTKMQLSEAKITPVPGVEKVIKKYAAARRNISKGLYRIEQYERDIQILSDQFSTIDNQLRTGTSEISRGNPGSGISRRKEKISSDYDQYSGGITRTGRRSNTTPRRSETVTTEEPRVNIEIVHTQLTAALQDVVGEYRRVLNLVDRWPGGLPPKVSRTMLQEDMDSASTELDRLYRYQLIYPTQGQSQIPERGSTDHRRY